MTLQRNISRQNYVKVIKVMNSAMLAIGQICVFVFFFTTGTILKSEICKVYKFRSGLPHKTECQLRKTKKQNFHNMPKAKQLLLL